MTMVIMIGMMDKESQMEPYLLLLVAVVMELWTCEFLWLLIRPFILCQLPSYPKTTKELDIAVYGI